MGEDRTGLFVIIIFLVVVWMCLDLRRQKRGWQGIADHVDALRLPGKPPPREPIHFSIIPSGDEDDEDEYKSPKEMFSLN